ncbi:MAG: hypothetical protein KKD38_07060, partial [Candidatus Delongbacteria bacterium]|nr:hypothetical protein [Candidatus Delongbacteria bacterium]
MKLYAKVVLFLFVLISFFSISIAEDLWMKLGWIEPTDKIFYTCQNEIYINTEDSITQYSQYRSKDNGSSWEKLNYHEWCRGVKYVSNDGNYLYLTAFDSIDGNGVVVSSRLFKVHKDSTNLNPLLKIGCTSMNKCRDNFYFLQWGKIIKSNMNLSDSSIVIDTNNKS